MKLIIWGIGQSCVHVVRNLKQEDIVAYVDSFSDKKIYAGKPVLLPEELAGMSYDAIIVASIYTAEIRSTCVQYGIDLDKVIYPYANIVTEDLNRDYDFISRMCGKEYAEEIRKRYHMIREVEHDIYEEKLFDIDQFADEKMYKTDYIRLKTLELLTKEIYDNSVMGETAELGVFQGEFAQFMNQAFPDKKLYLFDTFEGFVEQELLEEREGIEQEALRDTYKNTSVELVLGKMKYHEQVVVKKGIFPESLNGLEEKFAFVSLDCDWEESLYQGLCYFYPRLSEGGYIVVHDYNNYLTCARNAIKRYEKDFGLRIARVPVCDAQGTVVMTK